MDIRERRCRDAQWVPVAEAGNHVNNHSVFTESDISKLDERLLAYQKEFLCMGLVRVHIKEHKLQRYWVFGLCLSSGFFLNNNEKHNVSETGSVSVLRSRCLSSPEDGNRSSFRNVVFFIVI
jgi:hypothetical protein